MSGVTNLGDARFARSVERLHSLGPRPIFELFCELGAQYLLRTEIEQAVARYAGINHDTLVVGGGDQLPALPIDLIADRLDAALGLLRDAETGIGDPAVLHQLDRAGIAIEDAENLVMGWELGQ